MDKAIGIFAIVVGLIISAVSGYFSIIGIAALFSASMIPVIIMASSLELAKITGAIWLHRNWDISPSLLKYYILFGVIVLMIITSLGIFGFLSKAHLSQESSVIVEQTELELINNRISFMEESINSTQKELESLDSVIEGYIRNDRITQSIEVRQSQEEIRLTLNNTLNSDYDKLANLKSEAIVIEQKIKESDIKLGPIVYIMELFGLNNIDQTVRMFILVIMVVFDPIAICLLLAGQWVLLGNSKIIRQKEAIDIILKEEDALAKIVNRKKQIRLEQEKENKILEKHVQLLAQKKRFESSNSIKDVE